MLDILAFGAHPDDLEIGIGGTLARHAHQGCRCGMVDLTRGERASNGTVAQRAREGEKAAQVLGVEVRLTAGLPDAYLRVDRDSLHAVVEIIRRFRPRIVLAPYPEDLHPDHTYAGKLVQEACYLSGLRKYPVPGEAFRPSGLFYYFLWKTWDPVAVVDISPYITKKWQAIACHRSQFSLPEDGDLETLVNSPIFVNRIRSRDQLFGSLIGVEYGEGLVPEGKIPVKDLLGLEGYRPGRQGLPQS